MKLKPGVSTTEFWTVAGAGIAGTALACLGLVDGEWVVGATTILGVDYTSLRAGLKKLEAERNPTSSDDAQPK
jgi:hypothetical protein